MIDQRAIEEHIRGILTALGDDPDREGLKDTPKRVAQMYAEVFEGMNYTNHEIAEMFGKTFEEGFELHPDGSRAYATWWDEGSSCRRRSDGISRIS